MKFSAKVGLFGALMWLVIVIGFAAGWVLNIVKLIGTHGPFDLLFIARCIGVIAAPLGAVLGYVG